MINLCIWTFCLKIIFKNVGERNIFEITNVSVKYFFEWKLIWKFHAKFLMNKFWQSFDQILYHTLLKIINIYDANKSAKFLNCYQDCSDDIFTVHEIQNNKLIPNGFLPIGLTACNPSQFFFSWTTKHSSFTILWLRWRQKLLNRSH